AFNRGRRCSGRPWGTIAQTSESLDAVEAVETLARRRDPLRTAHAESEGQGRHAAPGCQAVARMARPMSTTIGTIQTTASAANSLYIPLTPSQRPGGGSVDISTQHSRLP